MRCYLSFSDREVFEGVTPPEGMPSSLVEGAEPPSVMTVPAIISQEQTIKETPEKPVMERKCHKFARWEKVLHPSWPVVVAGQAPLTHQEGWSGLMHLWPITTSLQM